MAQYKDPFSDMWFPTFTDVVKHVASNHTANVLAKSIMQATLTQQYGGNITAVVTDPYVIPATPAGMEPVMINGTAAYEEIRAEVSVKNIATTQDQVGPDLQGLEELEDIESVGATTEIITKTNPIIAKIWFFKKKSGIQLANMKTPVILGLAALAVIGVIMFIKKNKR